MKRVSDSSRHDVLVRYLLGELNNDERESVEISLLTEEESQNGLSMAANEMADRYVNGRLLPEQRHLLDHKLRGNPEWESRLEAACAVTQVVQELAVKHNRRRKLAG